MSSAVAAWEVKRGFEGFGVESRLWGAEERFDEAMSEIRIDQISREDEIGKSLDWRVCHTTLMQCTFVLTLLAK